MTSPDEIDDALSGFLFAQNMDFVMKSVTAYKAIFDGDSTTMFIFFAMARASVEHLNREKVPRDEAARGVFPDTLRRPVSILGIADYLGLPYETTRRHVMKLVEQGFCQRQGSREFFISEATMSRPEFRALSRETLDLSISYIKTVSPYIEI